MCGHSPSQRGGVTKQRQRVRSLLGSLSWPKRVESLSIDQRVGSVPRDQRLGSLSRSEREGSLPRNQSLPKDQRVES